MEHRLQILRKDILHMTQKEFAQYIDMTQSRVSQFENGDRGIPMNVLQRLAEYALEDSRIDILWLLTGKRQEALSSMEANLLQEYRLLDERGQNHVLNTLYREREWIQKNE